MKLPTRIVILLAICSAIAPSISGCSGASGQVVGKWVYNAGDPSISRPVIEYFNDGTFTQGTTQGSGSTVDRKGTWKVTSAQDSPAISMDYEDGDSGTTLFSIQGSKMFVGADKAALDGSIANGVGYYERQ